MSIPVMAKCRIGHFVESQILQQIGVDCIDESEVLTVADEDNHVNKTKFKVRRPDRTARRGWRRPLCFGRSQKHTGPVQ